jgi:hypothetical protein
MYGVRRLAFQSRARGDPAPSGCAEYVAASRTAEALPMAGRLPFD